MSEVTTEITIDAPPQKVWDVVMDPTRLHEWVTIHKGVSDYSTAKAKEGDTMKQRLALRGAPFTVNWNLDDAVEGKHALWKGRGPARSKAESEYTLTETDGGKTHFSYRNEYKAPMGPLGSVASKALVGGVPLKEAKASLANLKALLET